MENICYKKNTRTANPPTSAVHTNLLWLTPVMKKLHFKQGYDRIFKCALIIWSSTGEIHTTFSQLNHNTELLQPQQHTINLQLGPFPAHV